MDSDDAPWLNEVEADAWVSLVTIAAWLQPALDTQLRREAGIGHFEYGVLSTLSSAAGETMRLSDLALSANSSYSRLSKVLDRLHARGWVERHPDPSDGRTTLATLTSAGMAKVVATAPGHVRRVRDLVFDHLSGEEVAHLRSIASKLAGAVGPEGAAAERMG